MKTSAGIQYGITAFLLGYPAFFMMMQTVNGGPFSWWGPIVLGAAILLIAVSVRAFAPRLSVIWLAAIAAVVPLGICSMFGEWPLRCWIFAAILGICALTILRLEETVGHGDLAAFSLSVLLAASWTAVSINTIRDYYSSPVIKSSGASLVVLGIYWALIIGALMRSGTSVLRGYRS